MVTRRHLLPEEMLAAAETLQIALIDGITRARRWGKSELAFQGGTSLHLAYGSPRASEDLDFIVASDKGLSSIMEAALAHVRTYVREALGPETELELKARPQDTDKREKNPRIFTVSFRAPAFLEAVKVKAEFYVASPAAVARYDTDVRAVRLSHEAQMRRPIRLAISQAIVPTARLGEIFADKIYAIGSREYLKHRDVFDLWWLDQQGAVPRDADLLAALAIRRALYPKGPAIDSTLAHTLRSRAEQMRRPRQVEAFSAEMARWLALSGAAMLSSPGNMLAIVETAAAHVRSAAQLIDARKIG